MGKNKGSSARGQKVGNLYLQVLSAGSSDLPPALLLFCEREAPCNYLINCPEGMQKFSTEHRLRVPAKLKRVLMTRMTWEQMGGLPGMLLTMDGVGQGGTLQVHGAQGTGRLTSAFRHFVARPALPRAVHEVRNGETVQFEESGIGATPLLLRPGAEMDMDAAGAGASTGTAEPPTDDALESAAKRPRLDPAERPTAEASMLGIVADVTAICWLLQMPGVPPKFDAAAASALGVPKGPLCGQLCAGRPVTLPDGRTIEPEQVLGGGGAGELVLLADCPSEAHVRRLLLELPRATSRDVDLVVHMSPPAVQASAAYAAWRAALPAHTTQLVIEQRASMARGDGAEPQRFAFASSARLQLKLHGLHSGVFPEPQAAPHYSMPFHPSPPSPPPPPVQPTRSSASTPPEDAAQSVASGDVEGGDAAGDAAASVQLGMLGRLVLRPRDKAGPCADDESRLLCWQNSSGASLSLSRAELHAELEKLPTLAPILRGLPPQLHEEEGSWQHMLRAPAGWQPPIPGDEPAAAAPTAGADESSPAMEVEAGAEAEAEAEAEVAAASCAAVADSAAELVFLGTGAAIPSKYRNVSSILLQLPGGEGGGGGGGGGLVLDAGEGTLGSLRRRFGAAVGGVIAGLELVWISHMHADHHLGLLGLLQARRKLGVAAPLLVVAPHAMQSWLRDAAATLEQLAPYRYVHCAAAPTEPSVAAALRRLGLEAMGVAAVHHCPDAWAVSVQHARGWGAVYSGDTRPCEGVVRLGQALRAPARILIHEATFDGAEGMQEEARAKRHSTVAEALDVGRRMGAWRVVLTHFSQRYPKLADVRGAATRTAVVAFDLMTMPLRLMPVLPALTPALLSVFAEELDEDGGVAVPAEAAEAAEAAAVMSATDAPDGVPGP